MYVGVFSSDIYQAFKNTYLEEHLGKTASALPRIYEA